MKYLLVLFYTLITSFLYFSSANGANDSFFQLFIVTLILFLPILSSVSSYRLNPDYLHLLTIFAFCIGFIFGSNSNLGPIALIFWLIAIIPGIITLNLICYLYKKNRGLEEITDPYTPSNMFKACKKFNATVQTNGNKNV